MQLWTDDGPDVERTDLVEDEWQVLHAGVSRWVTEMSPVLARVENPWRWLPDGPAASQVVEKASSNERFELLREQWESDTAFLSNLTRVHMHPAYQQIIGMGTVALPLIVSRLAIKPGHWFWALASITGRDVAAGARTFSEARERWLTWARENGHAAA